MNVYLILFVRNPLKIWMVIFLDIILFFLLYISAFSTRHRRHSWLFHYFEKDCGISKHRNKLHLFLYFFFFKNQSPRVNIDSLWWWGEESLDGLHSLLSKLWAQPRNSGPALESCKLLAVEFSGNLGKLNQRQIPQKKKRNPIFTCLNMGKNFRSLNIFLVTE